MAKTFEERFASEYAKRIIKMRPGLLKTLKNVQKNAPDHKTLVKETRAIQSKFKKDLTKARGEIKTLLKREDKEKAKKDKAKLAEKAKKDKAKLAERERKKKTKLAEKARKKKAQKSAKAKTEKKIAKQAKGRPGGAAVRKSTKTGKAAKKYITRGPGVKINLLKRLRIRKKRAGKVSGKGPT